MGRNALLLYFGSHIVMHELYVIGDPPLASRIRDPGLPVIGDAQWPFAVAFIAAFFALAWVLHRRRSLPAGRDEVPLPTIPTTNVHAGPVTPIV
jgi:hypothetical protein